jgi:hypothetical protein
VQPSGERHGYRCKTVPVGALIKPWPTVNPMTVGDLVQDHRGRWITEAPTHCPVGHRLGAGQVLVGHVACMGHGGGGHTLWHCRACPTNVNPTYGPPLNLHCSVLAGPAAVRISSRAIEV